MSSTGCSRRPGENSAVSPTFDRLHWRGSGVSCRSLERYRPANNYGGSRPAKPEWVWEIYGEPKAVPLRARSASGQRPLREGRLGAPPTSSRRREARSKGPYGQSASRVLDWSLLRITHTLNIRKCGQARLDYESTRPDSVAQSSLSPLKSSRAEPITFDPSDLPIEEVRAKFVASIFCAPLKRAA